MQELYNLALKENNLLNLRKVINKRTVGIVLLGKSIENLEINIESLRNKDICWMSLNLFSPVEDFILSKIDKRLDIVYDSCSLPQSLAYNYETKIRLPRITRYIERNDTNMWITSYGIIRDSICPFGLTDWYMKQRRKILLVDILFPQTQKSYYMGVPNSATLMIASAIAGGASKIILFGCDGYRGDVDLGAEAYFHPELIRLERIANLGSEKDPGINRDTDRFAERITSLINTYNRLFGNYCPIINCSDRSVYNMFPKINYDKLLEEV